MRPRLRLAIALLLVTASSACGSGHHRVDRSKQGALAERVRAKMERLRLLYQRPPAPEPQDWLAVHPEPGQTFEQYLSAEPRVPDATRRILYVQPLGELSSGQRALVAKTAELLGAAYSLEVRTRPALLLDPVPPAARRPSQGFGRQLLTSYVLTELATQLPADATALLALTASDLWPGEGWRFVFGQATLKNRVGVWSLARLGNADGTADEFRDTLRRTLKIAVHETGHMFTIRHCSAYRCVMAGNNGLAELDRTPLAFCPEDLAKLLWATGDDASARLARMRAFAQREGLEQEAEFLARVEKALADR